MRHALWTLFCAATALAPTTAAQAHHGWSGYTAGEIDALVEITSIDLRNPHDSLTVVDDDGTEWSLTLAPRTRNQRFGFGEDTFTVGDRVRIVGEMHPSRPEAKTHQIWLEDELIYEYFYDSGQTSFERLGRATPDS